MRVWTGDFIDRLARLRVAGALTVACLLFAACEATLSDEENTSVAQPVRVGEGTAEAPYTVGQVLAGVERTADVWVVGYAVGYMTTNTIKNAVFDCYGANDGNLLLAASADEKTVSLVLPVTFTKDAKDSGSMAYDQTRYKRAVMLHATVLTQVCSTFGLKDVDRVLWIDKPETLDLSYPQHETDVDTDESSGEEDEAEDGDSEDEEPEDSDPEDEEPEGDDPTGDESENGDDDDEEANIPTWFSTDGISDVEDVASVNDKWGSNEDYPFTPSYLLKDERWKMFSEAWGWIIGYVSGWLDEEAGQCILADSPTERANNKTIVLDLEEGKMREWFRRSFKAYGDKRMLRIECKKLKLVNSHQRIHAKEIRWLDWVIYDL